MKPTSLAIALAATLSSSVRAEEREVVGAPAPPYHDIQTRRVPSTPLPISIHKDLTTDDGSFNFNPYEFVYYEVSNEASMNSIHTSSSSTINTRDDDSTDTIVDTTTNNNDNGTYLPPNNDAFVLPPSMQDEERDCAEWALAGECNANPNFMLRKCVRSCLQNMEEDEYDLLQWGVIDHDLINYVEDENCHDKHAVAIANGEVEEGEEDCEDWASEGLCKSVEDKAFMLDRCAATCMVCIPPGQSEFEIGAPQEIADENLLSETLDIMIRTSQYMSKTVMDTQNTKYSSVRRDCRNLDPLCAFYAAEGGCFPNNESYEWMVLNCAPVCQTCELLDFNVRCPIPENAEEALSRHGGDNGLNAMFERIVGERDLTQKQIDDGMEDLDYTVEVFSRPFEEYDDVDENIIDGPWVVVLNDFLTEEECERLIELGHNQGYEQSTETTSFRDGSVSEKQVSKRRTSTNTFCTTCDVDPIASRATNKIATVTGFPVEFSEDLQLLQYHPGQFYKEHHDYIPTHKHGPSGPRVLTVLLYLNDVEGGGATRFNELAEDAPPVEVKPKRGSALIWPSVLDEDILEQDYRTSHEALIVEKGMKYAANAWLHLRDEKNFGGIACG